MAKKHAEKPAVDPEKSVEQKLVEQTSIGPPPDNVRKAREAEEAAYYGAAMAAFKLGQPEKGQ